MKIVPGNFVIVGLNVLQLLQNVLLDGFNLGSVEFWVAKNISQNFGNSLNILVLNLNKIDRVFASGVRSKTSSIFSQILLELLGRTLGGSLKRFELIKKV